MLNDVIRKLLNRILSSADARQSVRRKKTVFEMTGIPAQLESLEHRMMLTSTPILAGVSNLAYTERQAATPIDPAITVTDVGHTTMASATVKLTNYVAGQDAIGFVANAATMGNISAAFSPTTGVLTLSSAGKTATIANFQAALRAVTYSNTSLNPTTTTRTVAYQVNDGSVTNNLSNVVNSTISITALNNAPILAGTSTLAYTEAQAATVINNLVTVNDFDNATLSSATVKLTNYVTGQDVLGFVANAATMGNIAGSFSATTGLLTLTSAGKTATLANFQAALRAVTYSNTSHNPTTTTRSVAYQLNDGSATSNFSNVLFSTITITSVNNAPVLAGTSTLAYTEAQAAGAINKVLTVSDLDNTTLASATVKLTNYVSGQDVLGFVAIPATMGNITGSFSTVTGVLTLTSAGKTATLANFQTALRAVTYSNTSHNPTTTTRSVGYQVNDGSAANNLSNVLTSTITVTAVNNASVLAGSSTLAYTEAQAATVINKVLTISDLDNTTLASATVKLTNYVAGQDVLGFVASAATMGNILGSFSTTTGVLTLTSAGKTATLANFQAALRAVTYSNTSLNPTTTTRSVAYQVNDGSAANNLSNALTSTITITAVNNAPVLAGTSTLAYLEAQAATAINKLIAVGDADNTTLASATVKLTNYVLGQDVLGFVAIAATMGNITGSFSTATGVLTLTSAGKTATLANFQAALRAVTYSNTSNNPTTTARSVAYQVNDGSVANNLSNVLTSTITITAVNSAPVLLGTSTLAYSQNQAATVINSAITISDADNTTLASATVKVTNDISAEDVLGFVANAATMGNIVGSFSTTTGILTLTSAGKTATLANFQAALRAVTYHNAGSTPTATTRSVAFQVNDGSAANNLSNVVTSSITITNFNGSYTGSYIGSVVANGMTIAIPGPLFGDDNSISLTILNGVATIGLPGINGNGTGTLASNGAFSATATGGDAGGQSVNVKFVGTFVINADKSVTGTGTWTVVNSPGVTGSGTWTVHRPA